MLEGVVAHGRERPTNACLGVTQWELVALCSAEAAHTRKSRAPRCVSQMHIPTLFHESSNSLEACSLQTSLNNQDPRTAESLGIVTGLVGIAAAFGAWIEWVEYIRPSRHFGRDFQTNLLTRNSCKDGDRNFSGRLSMWDPRPTNIWSGSLDLTTQKRKTLLGTKQHTIAVSRLHESPSDKHLASPKPASLQRLLQSTRKEKAKSKELAAVHHQAVKVGESPLLLPAQALTLAQLCPGNQD
ncbi:hypothetical protein MMC16_007405 [Acarospora aff. strigata]|nr:hypothetical protein [Acarospora aff. strigata]